MDNVYISRVVQNGEELDALLKKAKKAVLPSEIEEVVLSGLGMSVVDGALCVNCNE